MNWLLRLVFSVAPVCLFSGQGFAVEIIGHRGASHDAPENTLAAVNLAWLRGADAVEVDVHLSKDGHVVAVHDKTTRRYGGPDRQIGHQTLKELKSIDVGHWKNRKYSGERIPTLSEILATIPGGKKLYIEVKVGSEIVPKLPNLLNECGKHPDQVTLIGYSYETMTAAKQALPRHSVYLVVRVEQDQQTGIWQSQLKEMIDKAKSAKLDGLSLGDAPRVINRAFVRKIEQAGLKLQVWTVNNLDVARRLHDAGVDGLTTDRPGWLKKRLFEPQNRFKVEQSSRFCKHRESIEPAPEPVATANKGPIP